jgi:hypothetical protein
MSVPAAPPAPIAPAKKPLWKRWWFIALVIVVAAGALSKMAGGGSGTTAGSTSTPAAAAAPATEAAPAEGASPAAAPASDTITLKASATGEGTVMWMHDGSSNSEKFTGEWSKEVPYESGDWTVSVTGDILGGDDQRMTCEIIVKGESKEAKEGSGAAGSAGCSTIIW